MLYLRQYLPCFLSVVVVQGASFFSPFTRTLSSILPPDEHPHASEFHQDIHCGRACVIVLIGGAILLLSLLLMSVTQVYRKFTIQREKERFRRREREFRFALESAPGFAKFIER